LASLRVKGISAMAIIAPRKKMFYYKLSVADLYYREKIQYRERLQT